MAAIVTRTHYASDGSPLEGELRPRLSRGLLFSKQCHVNLTPSARLTTLDCKNFRQHKSTRWNV